MLTSQLKPASDQDRMDGPQYWSQEMMVMKPPPPHPPLPSTSSITTRPHRNPHKEQRPLNCPRCNSSYTKFCYYNNYSLSQPRYFCKSCRRYWTEGGSLRNVPVGGGSRKNKRSSSNSNISNKPAVDCTAPNPKFNEADYHPQYQQRRHGEDLNLSFTTPQHPNLGNSPSSMDVLSTSTAAVYSGGGGFGLQDLRSSTIANSGLNFPINGDMGMGEARYDHCQKLEQNRGDEADPSSGFWNW